MKVMGLLRLRQRSRSFREAYPPSATATIVRSGCQRLTNKSICEAQSVRLLCLLPRSWVLRSEGARAQTNGKAHTREAHGTSANSVRHSHLRALVLTRWEWLERAGSR